MTDHSRDVPLDIVSDVIIATRILEEHKVLIDNSEHLSSNEPYYKFIKDLVDWKRERTS